MKNRNSSNGSKVGKAAPVYINPQGNCMQIAGYQYQTTRNLDANRTR